MTELRAIWWRQQRWGQWWFFDNADTNAIVACSSAIGAAQNRPCIFNHIPMPPPNADSQCLRCATAIFQSHFHPCWLLCAYFFIPQNARVYFKAPCDCKLCQQCAVNDSTCLRGCQRHYPSFLSVARAPLWWKLGHHGRVQISWSNSWGADLGCGLCSCKSLEHGIWAILHPKMPWYYIKNHPLFHLVQPKYPYIFLKYASKKWGIWDVTVGVFVFWYLSTEQKLVKKNHLNGIIWQILTYLDKFSNVEPCVLKHIVNRSISLCK